MYKKRGQASIEFMATYGWAIIIVTLSIGALYLIGVQPKQFITNQCTFIDNFECLDAQMVITSSDDKIINMSLINRMDSNIDIIRVICTFQGEKNETEYSTPIPINVGQSEFVYCDIPAQTENLFIIGEKANARITVIYTKQGFSFPGAVDGTIVGTVVN